MALRVVRASSRASHCSRASGEWALAIWPWGDDLLYKGMLPRHTSAGRANDPQDLE